MAVRMVDITDKKFTMRKACAHIRVVAPPALIRKIRAGKLAKGDCLTAAQLAGIMAAKKTAGIIPLCHQIALASVAIEFKFRRTCLEIISTVAARYATGVEMEALTACACAALTVYDMAKAETRDILLTDLQLLKKTGGKSGDYVLRPGRRQKGRR